jgi:NAD(P)-dependent dehydrogenase (short-subunit alcohol dehydrogenase family)
MSMLDPTALLRPGLLDGVAVVLARAPGGLATGEHLQPGRHVSATCAGLGARVFECPVSFDSQLEIEEDTLERGAQAAAESASSSGASVVVLVLDGASLFAFGREGEDEDEDEGAARVAEGARRGLRACLAAGWIVTRSVAAGALLPEGRGGRIVYLAPPAAAGEHADAARAGLENLARTLSIEWARHAITTVAIAPGRAPAAAAEVAALTAYLASPAGAYFSGCLLDLRGPAGAPI